MWVYTLSAKGGEVIGVFLSQIQAQLKLAKVADYRKLSSLRKNDYLWEYHPVAEAPCELNILFRIEKHEVQAQLDEPSEVTC